MRCTVVCGRSSRAAQAHADEDGRSGATPVAPPRLNAAKRLADMHHMHGIRAVITPTSCGPPLWGACNGHHTYKHQRTQHPSQLTTGCMQWIRSTRGVNVGCVTMREVRSTPKRLQLTSPPAHAQHPHTKHIYVQAQTVSQTKSHYRPYLTLGCMGIAKV